MGSFADFGPEYHLMSRNCLSYWKIFI